MSQYIPRTAPPFDLSEIEARPSSAPFAVTYRSRPWKEVVRTLGEWTLIDANEARADALFARLGHHNGFWYVKLRREVDAESGAVTFRDAKYTQLTDWVAWRTSETRTFVGDTQTIMASYGVTVITEVNRRYEMTLSARESLSPRAIQRNLFKNIDIPNSRIARLRIRSCLAILGHEEQTKIRIEN